jgi:hypothetical protein
MRIGELAKQSGLSVHTIRYYETIVAALSSFRTVRIGLAPARSTARTEIRKIRNFVPLA